MDQLKVVICHHCHQHQKVICRPRPCFLPRQLPAEGIKANARQNTGLFMNFGLFTVSQFSNQKSLFISFHICLYPSIWPWSGYVWFWHQCHHHHQHCHQCMTHTRTWNDLASILKSTFFSKTYFWTTDREDDSIPKRNWTPIWTE